MQIVGGVEKFRATVSSRMLSKADRFFDNSLKTIFTELVQNSRRAGATHLEITSECVNGVYRIVLLDDGPGIVDPKTLLTLGFSAWSNDALEVTEDPAGMGFYSLAQVGCIVRSRDWSMELTREQFIGEADIEAVRWLPETNGVEIEFYWQKSSRDGYDEVRAALDARYCPLKISYNGEPIPQDDFLGRCAYVEEYKGLRIGVTNGDHSHWNHGIPQNVNFFGLIAGGDLPAIADLPYHVLIDVTARNEHLRLELPDRKKVIKDEFWQEVYDHATVVLFRTIRDALGGKHTLSFEDWHRAKDLRIELPEPPAELESMETWSLSLCEDHTSQCDRNYPFSQEKVLVSEDSERRFVRVSGSFDDYAHTLCMLDDVLPEDIVLVSDLPRYEGYTWYDGLPTLTKLVVTDGEKTLSHAEDGARSWRDDHREVVQKLLVELHISDPKALLTVPVVFAVDMVVLGSCGYGLDDTGLVVSQELVDRQDGQTPDDLWIMMWRAAYNYNDEGPDRDTQEDEFSDELSLMLRRIFRGNQQAAREEIASELSGWKLRNLFADAECSSASITFGKNGYPIIKFRDKRRKKVKGA